MLSISVLTWLYAAWLTVFIVLSITRAHYTGLFRTSRTHQLSIALSATLSLSVSILASLFTKNIVTQDVVSAANSISITYTMVR